ncbi:zinc-ribbon domain-containing protein [Streptomyces sp. ME109]|uniref:zinc-ribbon domain-containing protein n=1 Tax=Streptomyces sp. me109 TaxID=1827853 RepID=UPI0011CDF185|nr:zinc-ribbon domain-containing protein [Streptomyces sp. me109]
MARLTDANRLSMCRPDVAEDWDYDKNEDTPAEFTVSSNAWKWWICREGHPSFERKIEQRTRKNPLKCPECPARRPVLVPRSDADPLSTAHLHDGNRLSMCRPDVAEDWDYDKNYPHTPDDVSVSSSARAWFWKCPTGKHPSYPSKVSTRTRERFPAKCPECPRRPMLAFRVTDENRLSICRPDLVRSWNKERNLPLTPEQVSLASGKTVIWDCLDNPKHPSWPAAVSDRVGSATREGTGCPDCSLVRTSRPELRLKAELSRFLTVDPEPNKALVDGGVREEVDIADPGRRLVVEFDGAYFHGRPGGLERDIAKTRRLRDSGWTVVRVREHSLTKVDPGFDITVDKDAHPYKVAVAVVEHLALLGFISATAAETYVQAGALQAKELSDAWIAERLGSAVSNAERDSVGDKWDRMHAALESFQARFGHCRVPDGILVQGVDLRTWCYSQRAAHRQGKLAEDRRQRLESIPSWTFDALSGKFWDGHEKFQNTFNWNGAGQRNPEAETEEVHEARRWAQKLRERRRNRLAEGRDLPAYQVEAMDALPGWSWTPRDSRFEEQIDVLVDYCHRLGTTLASVKDKDVWDGHKIGMWVTNWRSSRPRLTVEQVSDLEALPGWTWSKNADAWAAKLAALTDFGKAHGHVTPSLMNGDEHEHALARWKHKYKSKLRGQDNERARRLRELLAEYGEVWP